MTNNMSSSPPTPYMERTTQIQPRIDNNVLEVFRWVLFKKLDMQHGGGLSGKGALSKGVEDAMQLYIRNYIEGEMATPIAELVRRIIDGGGGEKKEFQSYLQQSGMKVYDLVMDAVALYLQLPEKTRKEIRQLQIESNMTASDAAKHILKSEKPT
jgi:hypothetical protein